jgi:hypothetical protein
MGRRPKQAIEQVATVNETTVSESLTSENKMMEMLMKQVEDLQKQLLSMQSKQSQPKVETKMEERPLPETKTEKIDAREYIKVMSLSNIPLNLTTEPLGRGRLFQFEKFGDTKRIMYDDLIKIVYNHPTFTQSGRFLIMNPDVVKEIGYEEEYAKILTKEKIEAILNNKQDAIDLYKSANAVQKKIIHEILIRKVRDDLTSVDTGLIVAIKRASNIDIIAEAELIKKSVRETN